MASKGRSFRGPRRHPAWQISHILEGEALRASWTGAEWSGLRRSSNFCGRRGAAANSGPSTDGFKCTEILVF